MQRLPSVERVAECLRQAPASMTVSEIVAATALSHSTVRHACYHLWLSGPVDRLGIYGVSRWQWRREDG